MTEVLFPKHIKALLKDILILKSVLEHKCRGIMYVRNILIN